MKCLFYFEQCPVTHNLKDYENGRYHVNADLYRRVFDNHAI